MLHGEHEIYFGVKAPKGSFFSRAVSNQENMQIYLDTGWQRQWGVILRKELQL